MTTAKQIEANRLNALLSTGPKTIEGKAAARRNALKHGLAGAGIVMPIDEEQLVQERAAELCSSLKPLHTFDLFLTEEVALEQLRAERCRRLERARRQRLAEDALERWDEDRLANAEQIGARLSKEPALSARLLQRTLQGCDWLLERWRGLGRALERLGGWDDAQRHLALDLLGTPPELRRGGTPLDAARAISRSGMDRLGEGEAPAEPSHISQIMIGSAGASPSQENGNDADPTATIAAAAAEAARLRVVADEIERLTRLRDEVLEPRDEDEQRAAFHGEGVETDPELQLLHRYEAVCQRRKAWALKQLNKGHAPSRPSSPRYQPPAPPDTAEPFLPPITGGAPTPREPQCASFSARAGIGEGEAPAEPRHIPQIINGSAGVSPSRETGIDLSKELKSAPSLPSLRGLREHFLPSINTGNRHARRARRARGLS